MTVFSLALSRRPRPSVSSMVEGTAEPELVARLREGDVSAFDEVYQVYRPRIFSFLARLSGRRDVAEDLSQETWIRLATKAQALRSDTHLAAWLFTVARNLFLSHCRSRQTDALRTGEMSCLALPARAQESPFAQAAASELAARLERALAGLPVPYREVLLLVGSEGLTPAEAARVLGVKPEAARQRLARGRALLAARLGTGRTTLSPPRQGGGT